MNENQLFYLDTMQALGWFVLSCIICFAPIWLDNFKNKTTAIVLLVVGTIFWMVQFWFYLGWR